MKKIVIAATAFAFFFSSSVIAQGFRVGVKLGSNLTKVDGKAFNDEYELGYQIGAFSEIDFSKKFGIQPEVLFSQVNTTRSTEYSDIYNNVFAANNTNKVQLKYLSIPILLRYNVGKLVTLNLGPQFSVLIDEKENLLKNGEKAFKGGDLSMVGGININIMRFRIYGKYNVGLSNINDIDNQDKWKSQMVQLGLGLKL